MFIATLRGGNKNLRTRETMLIAGCEDGALHQKRINSEINIVIQAAINTRIHRLNLFGLILLFSELPFACTIIVLLSGVFFLLVT